MSNASSESNIAAYLRLVGGKTIGVSLLMIACVNAIIGYEYMNSGRAAAIPVMCGLTFLGLGAMSLVMMEELRIALLEERARQG